jgi:N6-L-threonylcarbamoyladenine synthase
MSEIIKIKYLRDIEKIKSIEAGDWIDLRSAINISLRAGEWAYIPLGVAIELPKGYEYQEGEMLNFWNTREYVLFRDGHKCRCCKGKSKDKILEIHHIESRKTGGNAPNNLVTLCSTCHKGYHAGTVNLPSTIKRGNSYKDATFMGIMKWTFYNKVKEIYKPLGVNVSLTYGYKTKNTRILNKLPKEHFIDARCISGNPNSLNEDGTYYLFKKVRCHNRQIHKSKILKGGKRKFNQAPYLVKNYRLFDKVIFNNQICFIWGRRNSGAFLLKDLKGNTIKDGVNYKKLKLFEKSKHILSEVHKYKGEDSTNNL